MVSTKGRYALTVMVDLAKLSDGGYVSLADIAEKENLSMKYLESIISILNKGGLLQSLRGKNGGYKLARDPADYNIAEILLLTEGTLAPVNCIMQDGVQCEKAATCSTLPLWAGLDNVIDKYLSAITLEDIITGNDALRIRAGRAWCVACSDFCLIHLSSHFYYITEKRQNLALRDRFFLH